RRCKTDATSVNSDARSSGDDDAKNLAKRDTNLIWRALENSSLSKDDKELLINIAGSVLIHAPLANGGAATGPTYLQPSID
ncbi:hypothetical protein ACQUFE_18445, partial [Enterococcus casseliflavus]|uniref:hypothetical protein n=1 Tax=Enterococcus casseliflavus TaxID=37734 RepID=UPI003D14B4DD